jgi:hypothetical protein
VILSHGSKEAERREYLVFQSHGYNFALPASRVVAVHDSLQPLSVSFSETVFLTTEVESWSLVLDNGTALSVASVCDITAIPRTLPLPGYIFDSDTPDWIRGAHWDDETEHVILILNEERLWELLSNNVPDLQI